MKEQRLGVAESRFADLIWQEEPMSSGELVKLSEKEMGWKKSTTYTVLSHLCDKGLFVNDKGTVRALMSREEYYARRSEWFVEEHFDGSLPAFLAAFTARKALTAEDVRQLRAFIDSYPEK